MKKLAKIAEAGLGSYIFSAIMGFFVGVLPRQRDVFNFFIASEGLQNHDPRDIENLLRDDCSALPYLKDALLRHLQQFPSVRNGLNRLENQILTVVASGTRKLGPIFRAISDKEERRYVGDASLWGCINQLASYKEPLLRVSGPDSLAELMNINSGESPSSKMKKRRLLEVDITDMGKEVLTGRQDAIRLNGIDRWIGGVQLQGAEAAWRWEESSGKLMAGVG